MGRVIIKYKEILKPKTHDSFRCNSKEAARKIVAKRRNVKGWKYYKDGEKIPQYKKKLIKI